MKNITSEKMADGSTWYSCVCGEMYETRSSAKEHNQEFKCEAKK